MYHQNPVQLPDPNSKVFTLEGLKQAMLDTISSLNMFAEAEGVSEVRYSVYPDLQ
jgi:hypothetical protein